jgi:chromosome segregation ATPase
MNEVINMLDQEYVDNEEKLSVANSELDKEKSYRMSSENDMNDVKDSIKKLNNTIKDLSSKLSSPEDLDLLDLAIKALRTELAKEQQAKEQRENIEKRYEFILKRLDEINQNKSEVQSAQSLMFEAADKLSAAEQLKSDLKLSQTLQVDTANRLAVMQVEYEKLKAEHGELAQKCESKKHELALRDEEAKTTAKEAKRLLHDFQKKKRKFSELDDHED